jgi:hypothetical protein
MIISAEKDVEKILAKIVSTRALLAVTCDEAA